MTCQLAGGATDGRGKCYTATILAGSTFRDGNANRCKAGALLRGHKQPRAGHGGGIA